MKRKLQLAVGLLISGAFLYYSFSKADLPALWRTLQEINLWWAIPFVVLTLATMWIRALRWKLLLEPNIPVTAAQTWRPLMIGFAFNGIFPARAGEFTRAWLVAKRTGGPFTGALATVIVERLYDSFVLVAIILYIFTAYDFSTIQPRTWDSRWTLDPQVAAWCLLGGAIVALLVSGGLAWWGRQRLRHHGRKHSRLVAGIAVVGGFATVGLLVGYYMMSGRTTPLSGGSLTTISGASFQRIGANLVKLLVVLLFGSLLFVLPWFRTLGERIILAMPVPRGLRDKVLQMFQAVTGGFDSLKSPKTVVGVFGLTIALWVAIGATLPIMWWGFPASATQSMSVIDGLSLTMLICLAIMIPAAPGYWGLFEVGGVLSMQLLGITTASQYEIALGYCLVIHALQMIPIIVIGLWYAARENVSAAAMIAEAEQQEQAAIDNAEAVAEADIEANAPTQRFRSS